MALMKSSNVPKDAVLLDEIEAGKYAWEIVVNWENLSDTFALRYAPGVLGAVNALSGFIINNHYRNKLKLGKYGYFSSVLPITLMPGVLTALFHRYFISTEMLIMKNDACPICYEVKSALIQNGFGLAYPMVLGPTSALMFANRYATYRVPDLLQGPMPILKFVRQLTKPFTATLMCLSVFQFVASSVFTYLEMKNNMTLRRKLIELEERLEAQRNNN